MVSLNSRCQEGQLKELEKKFSSVFFFNVLTALAALGCLMYGLYHLLAIFHARLGGSFIK